MNRQAGQTAVGLLNLMLGAERRPVEGGPRRVRQWAFIAVVAVLVLASALEPAVAWERLVRFDGRVQWIAGPLMSVQPDFGLSVSVDLVRVPQDQYARLREGDRVVVTGVVRDGNRRVIGTAILRDGVEAP